MNVEIKGAESWWIAKSITPQLVVNQSKINPQLPSVVVDWLRIDLPLVRLLYKQVIFSTIIQEETASFKNSIVSMGEPYIQYP